MLGITFGWVQSSQEDNLNLHCIAARFVFCPLSLDRKENCVGKCQVLSEILEWDRDYFKIIIGSRNQAAVFSVEEPIISRHRRSRTNLLKCEVYWVVNYEFAAQEQTVKHNHYADSNCRKMCRETDLEIGIQGLVFPPWECTFPPSLAVHKILAKKQNYLAFHIFCFMWFLSFPKTL